MLNFEVKVSQRYFIWPVLSLWGVPYTDDSNSPADWYHASEVLQRYSTVRWRVCPNSTVRGFFALTGPLISILSADWESSIPVISEDQQPSGTVQGWQLKTLCRLTMCVLHEPMVITVHSVQGQRLFQYLPLDWHSLPLDHFSSHIHFVSTCHWTDILFRWSVWVIGIVLPPHKRSTSQMKYLWETLTSKLDTKTFI